MPTGLTARIGNSPNESVKAPVVAATTAPITLQGEQTIDGVACVVGDRVLVKDQADASANGIYDVSLTTWVRSPDLNNSLDAINGMLVLDTNPAAIRLYALTYTGDYLVDSTDLTATLLISVP